MKLFKKITIFGLLFFAANAFAVSDDKVLEAVVVTATPLNHSHQLTQATNVLEGDELLLKSQSTLGETLGSELGIRSTYYGPNASRPVIRGLGGDQINILQNGVSNLDASASSVDHNVAIDPLAVEKIEVIRGPAALLYGTKAVGGVVNLIDNRIADEKIDEKITGAIDARYNTVNRERASSILLEGGIGDYVWHLNGSKRISDDVKIPGFSRSAQLRSSSALEDGEVEENGRVSNSQNNSDSVTFGVSKIFDRGHFGVAFTNYRSRYGILGHGETHHEDEDEHHDDDDDHDDDDHDDDDDDDHHDEDEHEEHGHGDTLIDMHQKRLDVAGLYRNPIDYIKEVKYKIGLSDYEHFEIEGDQKSTTFKNKGYDGRVEFIHDDLGLLEGAFGFQFGQSDFSALGQEAFLAPTVTKNHSGFIFEEIALDDTTFQFGGRLDHQEVEVEESEAFGVKESRNDLMFSGSFGVVQKFLKEYSAALSIAYTQRAPNAQELHSNGQHLATSTFEIGDENLDIQKSTSIDFSLRKNSGLVTFEGNLFYNYFQDFIALAATGQEDHDSELPIFNYVNLPAEFYGAELKIGAKAYDKNGHKLNVELRGDYLQAKNRKTKEYLPRIAPPRVGLSLIYNKQKLGLRLDADYHFEQNDVAEFELETDQYIMLNFGVDYEINVASTSSVLYLKATNLLDDEARNHISFVKDRMPLPGRSLMIGVRAMF